MNLCATAVQLMHPLVMGEALSADLGCFENRNT